MTTTNQQTPIDNNSKTKILIIGAIIGALTGLGTAYLLVQRADEEEGLKMSAGDGAKLGVSVFSFLRQISQM